MAQTPRAEPPLSATGAAVALEEVLISAIARAEKSVVAIARVRRTAAGDTETADPGDPDFVPNEYASGVVVGANGLVLTNYHVLGNPEQNDYYVWIHRRPLKVQQVHRVEKVVAGDPWTDLAILQVDAEGLTPVQFGKVDKLKKGMIVLVLGNPDGLARDGEVSAGWGMLANTGRQAAPRERSLVAGSQRETLHHFGGLLQIDARRNLTASGAAVINLQGEMIGMTTSQAPLKSAGQSAGLAIPADDVFLRTVEHLKAGRRIEVGFLGVSVESIAQTWWKRGLRGVLVKRVVPGTPAHRAGLRIGDVITDVDQQPIETREDLFHYLGGLIPLREIKLGIQRRVSDDSIGQREEVTAVLSKRFSQLAGPSIGARTYPGWRGIHYDFATALSPGRFRETGHLLDSRGCIAVTEVIVDSAAWRAGIREGSFISHVDGQRVADPRQFQELVQNSRAAMEVTLCSENRQGKIVIVGLPE